jgi:argininosuccinate lyase
MSKIWAKEGAGAANQFMETFTAGRDPELDMTLITYDIEASRVHARGLKRIGLLTANELSAIDQTLDLLLDEIKADRFSIAVEQEDMHTAIEQFLIEKIGDPGKKIHTGRSRNDQVLTAMRLYEKDQLKKLIQQ